MVTNSTSAWRYWSSDSIETHSSGPWWPSPTGPNSTPGIPAFRKEMTSDVPSRPTAMLSRTGVVFDTACGQRLHVRLVARRR